MGKPRKSLKLNTQTTTKGKVLTAVFLILFSIPVYFFRAGYIAGSFNEITEAIGKVGKYLKADVPAVGGPLEPERPTIKDLPPEEQRPPVVEEEFLENIKKWTTVLFSRMENRICAEENDHYPIPSIWYEGAFVPLPFRKVVVEYKAQQETTENNLNPFIVSLGHGNGEEYLRVLLQEGESHLIGIAKVVGGDSAGHLTREEIKRSLDDAIKPETDVKVTIEAKAVNKSIVTYEVRVDYIAKKTGRPQWNTFSVDIESAHLSPDKIEARIGLGTTKGHCIQPLRYEFY